MRGGIGLLLALRDSISSSSGEGVGEDMVTCGGTHFWGRAGVFGRVFGDMRDANNRACREFEYNGKKLDQ